MKYRIMQKMADCADTMQCIGQGGNYVGFGLGASSMVENCRWKKYREYGAVSTVQQPGEQSVKEDCHELDTKECMEEFMFLGLRMMQGVSVSEFQILYGHLIEEIYGSVLNKWQNTGYLTRQNGYIRLTEKGIDVSNVIMADFLLDWAVNLHLYFVERHRGVFFHRIVETTCGGVPFENLSTAIISKG